MRKETLLLGIPKVLTAPRLARALATPSLPSPGVLVPFF